LCSILAITWLRLMGLFGGSVSTRQYDLFSGQHNRHVVG
jgi:hypothetical protein